MKRNLLFIMALMLTIGLSAQNATSGLQKLMQPQKDMNKVTRINNEFQKPVKGKFTENAGSVVSAPVLKNSFEASPKVVMGGNWATFKDFETGDLTMYTTDIETEQISQWTTVITSAKLHLLDENFEESGVTYQLDVPDFVRAGYQDVNIVFDRTSDYFAVYYHYFMDVVTYGNNMYKTQICDINTGDVLLEVPYGNGVNFTKNGKIVIMKYNNYPELPQFDGREHEIDIYDAATLTLEHTIIINRDVSNSNNSYAMDIREVDGKEYLVYTHYDIPYWEDMMNMIVNENNKLNLHIFDLDEMELYKSLSFPVRVSEEFGIYYFPAYGSFNDKFDFTKGIFSNDGKIAVAVPELAMSLSQGDWYDVINIYNEDGDIIKSYDNKIYTEYLPMLSPLEGHDDQMVFQVVEDGKTYFEFFNVQSFEPVNRLELVQAYNDDNEPIGPLYADQYDRIKVGDSYEFIITLSPYVFTQDDNGVYYGHVRSYEVESKSGMKALTETNDYALELSATGIYGFGVWLGEDYMNSKLYDESSNGPDFVYGYMEVVDGSFGSGLYKFSEAGGKPYYMITDSPEHGQFYGIDYLPTNVNGKPAYMIAQYQSGSVNAFYELPLFPLLGGITEEVSKDTSVYYDSSSQTIVARGDISNIQVNSVSGMMVYAGKAASVSTIGWVEGVYVVKSVTKDGKVSHTKLLVK